MDRFFQVAEYNLFPRLEVYAGRVCYVSIAVQERSRPDPDFSAGIVSRLQAKEFVKGHMRGKVASLHRRMGSHILKLLTDSFLEPKCLIYSENSVGSSG
jgi:hypothetical protein